MKAKKLAEILLKNPEADVQVGINESGCPVMGVQLGKDGRKKIVVISIDEVQESFLPECELKELK